MEKIAG